MSNRTNSFPIFVPDLSETPSSAGFKPATLISSSEVNGAIYMNYNFVNSFVNALIEKSSLTDSKEYSYKSTELKTLIEGDLDSWIVNAVSNGTLSKVTIANSANNGHLIATWTSIEIEDKTRTDYRYMATMNSQSFSLMRGTSKGYDMSNALYASYNEFAIYSDNNSFEANATSLTITNTDKENSSLGATSLVFTTNSGDDVGTYNDHSITFKTSEGNTTTYGESGASIKENDGYATYGAFSLTQHTSSTIYNELNYNNLSFHNGSFYCNFNFATSYPNLEIGLSNSNRVTIGILPEVAKTNVYSGFGTLNGVYTKEFTATSASEASTLDTNDKNFIENSGLTIHGITITRPFSSSDSTNNFIQLFVTRSNASDIDFSYYDVMSADMKSVTSLNNFYTTGTMSVKVICN